MKEKTAFIVIELVDESLEKPNEEIEKEIYQELSENIGAVPWLKKIVKITVLNE
ncbi:MAG: hypothetical protein QXN63_01590 [Candidatus Bathyarchaeia archaeon]